MQKLIGLAIGLLITSFSIASMFSWNNPYIPITSAIFGLIGGGILLGKLFWGTSKSFLDWISGGTSYNDFDNELKWDKDGKRT